MKKLYFNCLGSARLIFLILLSAALFPLAGKAQTIVGGGIYSNTTWTKANSPYIIDTTLVVFPSVTLTIEPGVEIRVDQDISIEVRGTLKALGLATDSIRFKGNGSIPSKYFWDEFRFTSGSTCMMNYCVITDAHEAVYRPAAGSVKHSRFHNNLTAIDLLSAYQFFVDSCLFENNNVAIYLWGKSILRNSTFRNNGWGITGQGKETYNCYFTDNEIGLHKGGNTHHCTFNGNHIAISNPDSIYCNTIINNDTAIHGYHGQSYFHGNKVCSNHFNYVHMGNIPGSLPPMCYCLTDSAAIAPTILDGYENPNLGLVKFMPILFCSNDTPVDSLCSKPALNVFWPEKAPGFRVYPNPMNDYVIVRSDEMFVNAEISFFNMMGEEVLSLKAVSGQEITLNRGGLQKGIYFVRVKHDGKQYSSRLIISD